MGVIHQLLFWSPRVLGILFALYLSLFAFDVFSGNYGAAEVVFAFLIHLTPAYIVLVVVYIAWYREKIGAIMFFTMILFYLALSGDRSWFIITPMIVIGFLYLIGSFSKRVESHRDLTGYI